MRFFVGVCVFVLMCFCGGRWVLVCWQASSLPLYNRLLTTGRTRPFFTLLAYGQNGGRRARVARVLLSSQRFHRNVENQEISGALPISGLLREGSGGEKAAAHRGTGSFHPGIRSRGREVRGGSRIN